MKKYTISPVAIIAYVVAALLAVDFVVSAAQTVSQVNEYYAAYGMAPGFGELVSYVLQNSLTTLIFAFLSFLGGYIVSMIWKLDPNHVKVVEPKEAKAEDADVVEVEAETEEVEAETEETEVVEVEAEEVEAEAAEETEEAEDAAEDAEESEEEKAADEVTE